MKNKKLDKNEFKTLLKSNRVTQKELAESIGLNEKTLSAYLNSENLDDEQKKKIAQKLHTSVDNLWKVKEDENQDYKTKYIALLEKRENEINLNLLKSELNLKLEANRVLLKEMYVLLKEHHGKQMIQIEQEAQRQKLKKENDSPEEDQNKGKPKDGHSKDISKTDK